MALNEQEQKIAAARHMREHLLRDRYRPGYHFAIPEDIGMPGDPNGAFWANGRYHLMYLYNRRDVKVWGGNGFSWGHISSSDLVHWRHHPDALVPGGDHGGCFSGGAFVDDDGTAYLTYWRLQTSENIPDGSGIGIARSRDPHFDEWEKLRIPTLDGTQSGILEKHDGAGNPLVLCNADPSNIWKKDGFYYLQAGNLPVLRKLENSEDGSKRWKGDWVDLFRSRDLVNWEYVHRFYARNPTNRWTDESEDDMCPSFLPLPSSPSGGVPSGKYLQLFISHNKGCQYYVGTYDEGRDLFLPETHGRMTWVDNTFFAPEALIDDKGRQIMWAWLLDNVPSEPEQQIVAGWSGVYCLPRTLWLGEDGILRMAPVPELSVLRYNPRVFDDVILDPDSEKALEVANGESAEINFSIESLTATHAGLKVRTSPHDEETTLLSCDFERNKLVFDSTRSGNAGRKVKEEAPFECRRGERIDLRVFIDRAVVEIFAGDRQAIARRVYPVRDDSTGVRLFCSGGEVAFTRIRTWEMMPSNAW
ncbi:MAG TPA: glycoside hydrolase family 32 protein [Candidatus Latescibacteria bacterium]|nr:glycoside hydrolase family 32 protein [Candidatus Latescibacterota bacterium]